MNSAFSRPRNILCFSSQRWDFVMRRPQQLLLRFAEQDTNVYFFEDPLFDAAEEAFLSFGTRSETLWKVVPHIKPGLTPAEVTSCLAELLARFLKHAKLDNWIFWYYTCSALSFSKNYRPKVVIYDCIDESAISASAITKVDPLEKELLKRADLVFKTVSFHCPVRVDWDNVYHHIVHQISKVVPGIN
ncbi:hypothetical protein [Pedobacter sp. L105]|uniref:hypothetical protein n=1 Tax=Pedobacter sp. L105 TaxID=1641871 RepID=UPI00131C2CC5|nr:hypothetical protein [Pedobacter sp. L105]